MPEGHGLRAIFVWAAVVVGAVVFAPWAARATSVVKFDFATLCGQSRQIAHVVCTSSRPLPTGDAAGVRTQTRFEVLETVKGSDRRREFALTLPGGEIDGRRVSVPGMPMFAEGDELVLFLSGEDAQGSPWPMGLNQGCYRVARDASGKRVVRLQHGVTPIPENAAFKPASGRPFDVGLRSFLDEIRATLGTQAAPAVQ